MCEPDYCIIVSPLDKPRCFWGRQWGKCLNKKNNKKRLLTNSYTWKAIPNYFFNKYGGVSFLLKCNFDSAKLDKKLPLFYRELLDYFQELTNNSQYITNDLILWNNKDITGVV